MRIAACLLCFFSCLSSVRGQLPASLNVTKYNETNSTINGTTTCFLQAQNGYLWLGSTDGLYRYDGYGFRPFPNETGAPNSITHLAEDLQHNIWMSFIGGEFARFDPSNGKFTNFILHNAQDSTIGSGEITTLFFDHRNQLWLGVAQKGLVRTFPEKNVSTIYPLVQPNDTFYAPAFRKIYNTLYKIWEDSTDRLWIATHDGLYTYDGGPRLLPVRAGPLKKNVLRRDLFNSIVPDGDSLWLGAWAGGLSSYNRKTGRWRTMLIDSVNIEKPTANLITDLAEKSRGELWVCSPDKGLGVYNKSSRSFYFFSNNKRYPNVPGDSWFKMITDKEGNLWASHEQGLLKIRVPDHKFYFQPVSVTHSDNREHYGINDVWEDESVQLIATGFADGLHVYQKFSGRLSILKVAYLKKEEQVMDVRQLFQDSRKRIWVISRDFIYLFDKQRTALVKPLQPPLYTHDSLSNSFISVTEDNRGNIWFGTRRNGIFILENDGTRYTHLANTNDADVNVPFSSLRSVASDRKKNIWFAGSEGTLGYFEMASRKMTTIPAGYGDSIRLQTNKSYALYADDQGNMWVGTLSGLYCFDLGAEKPVIKKVFKSADGLRSDLVFEINSDRYGNIWCMSDAGICLLPKGGLPISFFGAADGIDKGTGSRILRSRSDSMLMMHYGGYYIFSPHDFLRRTKLFPITITAMQVNDKPFYYENELAKNGRISLGADQNFFSFEFAALNFDQPEKEQYAYMLEGFDKDWINAGNRRFVSYTNIPGGSYVFRVRANPGKNKGRITEISLPIFVATPFQKTVWFYLILLVLVAGGLFLFYRNRIRHHQEIHQLQSKTQLLEKEKALVMYEGLKQQLNPHFLFNSLTSLNSLIVSDQKNARLFLEQMSKIYRYILRSRDHETVPLSDEITFVDTYIKLQKTRFREKLQVHNSIDEAYYHHKIVPVTLQNLVENALKHNIVDDESPLVIEMFTEDGYLMVRNNIQKKKMVETSNRQGLQNMKTLYSYLTDCPMVVEEDSQYFTVKIPLI